MYDSNTTHRFWSKVDKTPGCWMWTATACSKGYGKFKSAGKVLRAHRVSYEMMVGPIPEGMAVDHICHNTGCVNPDHLRLATTKQNAENRRGARRNSESGVRGVYRDPAGWRVMVGHNGEIISGGTYRSIDDAKVAAISLRNSFFTHNDMDKVVS